ncbi:MAG TPA: hypothetical protein PK239_15795 [Chitinophagales bacterium]|nr:hypothetical protein [Chitinophagales bacterium]HRK28737.1 hypothetical protein [Chitinophagales bacterium]
MKFGYISAYRIVWVACMLLMLAGFNQANAGVLNLQFANPTVNCVGGTPTTFCVTLQVRANSGGPFKIGNGTAFFQYNSNAINNPVKTAGSDAAFGTGSGYGFTPQFSFLEQGNIGEGNFNILLGSGAGSPTTDVTNSAWTNVAQFCFTIVNPAATANISFNTTYTGFNDQSNNPANSHTLGTTPAFSGGLSACSVVGTVVQLTAFLDGPYNTGSGVMNTNLNPNLIPLAQPYNTAPWNYAGTESVASIPAGMVDWVLVSAATLSGTTWTIAERKAAMLMSDGRIIDPTGGSTTGVTFGIAAGNYHFVIRHRNHIPTVSATTVTVPNATAYNFGTSNQSITLGANTFVQQRSVGTGANQRWVMRGGNANGDNAVNTSDRNQWNANNPASNVYNRADFTMDGAVNTSDRNRWNLNNPFSNTVIPQQ